MMVVGAGRNLLNGGGRNDFFNGESSGRDKVLGGPGDDSGELGGGPDVIDGGGGRDDCRHGEQVTSCE